MNSVHQAIAIIGMSGRFPGADTTADLWANLEAGRCAIAEIPPERWDASHYFSSTPGAPDRTYSRWGGFLRDIDRFDSLFFGISPREARLMDPQQRLLLEETWKALENAGYAQERLAGCNCGVFLGAANGDYLDRIQQVSGFADSFLLTGNTASTYGGRIAYFLDLRGPCLVVDTACSSALAAVHLACESIRMGQTEVALAGGASVMTTPKAFQLLAQTGLLSPTGQCRAFDEGADGYVLGEAVGMVMLKSLEHAVRDGDRVRAVIRASGINQDGRKNGVMAPNLQAQRALQLEVMKKAGIGPESISYVEGMGTGTRVGDAIEINALTSAFRATTSRERFCAIGALKPSIGHSGPSAGVASLIKVVLGLEHRVIVPSLHYSRDNQLASLERSPFYVVTRKQPWTAGGDSPRRAMVNASGFSGTNVCLVVEEALMPQADRAPRGDHLPHLATVSAKTPEALRQRISDLGAWLGAGQRSEPLSAVCQTLNRGRSQFRYRAAFVVRSLEDLRGKLEAWEQARRVGGAFYQGKSSSPGVDPKIQSVLNTLLAMAGDAAALDEAACENCLTGLAQFYVHGHALDWDRLYPPASRRVVSLPSYPFARESHWVSESTAGSASGQSLARASDSSQIRFYKPVWVETKALGLPAPVPSGVVLVFDATTEVLDELLRAGCQAILVKPGDACLLGDRVCEIRPREAGDYEQLLARFFKSGSRLGGIVHLWNRAPGDWRERHSQTGTALSAEVEEQLAVGLCSLLLLSKALNRQLDYPVGLVCCHACQNLSTPPHVQAIGGFGRALMVENPRLSFRLAVVSAEGTTPGRVCETVLRELGCAGPAEVRYDGDRRYARECVALAPAASAPDTGGSAFLPKDRGVYLITGGAGGLGLIFARWLARNYRAKLVLVGRSALSASKSALLTEMEQAGGEVMYVSADVSDWDGACAAVRGGLDRFGKLDGVIHSAGVLEDALLVNKDFASMQRVFASKIQGTVCLDAATRDLRLDFFVLFSSIASVIGSVGQCDYSAANRFLDGFAELREQWRGSGFRHGRTLAINWPYWSHGGMRMPAETLGLMQQLFGLRELSDEEGIEAFLHALRLGEPQVAVLAGGNEAVRTLLENGSTPAGISSGLPTSDLADPSTDLPRVQATLTQALAELLQIDAARLDPDLPLGEFGLDSMLVTQLLLRLNSVYGLRLAPSVFIEHPSLRRLAQHLAAGPAGSVLREAPDRPAARAIPPGKGHLPSARSASRNGHEGDGNPEPVAIVGLAGVFPQARNPAALWKLLVSGKDAITEVPSDRWDWRTCCGDWEAEREFLRWGGFIGDVDKFDPSFFNLSPHEADLMDPQHRLFLQAVWQVIEDSGHRPSELWNSRTGVFVGLQSNDYAELWAGGVDAQAAAGLAHSMLANRVSYFFNWCGPSETIDTACASSAVAIHRALQSLRSGECSQAIVGGANLLLSPTSGLILSQLGVLSGDGKTRSFDRRAEGYVRGEGVCAVMLKPLSAAERDGDNIYALLLGSATSHGGRAASLLTPNPVAQADAVVACCLQAKVDPGTIGYIEASGTATPLGDTIELSAFRMAFDRLASEQGVAPLPAAYCGVGSLKPNIGHLEAASGVSGLIKAALALRHRTLPASLHFEEPCPEATLAQTPFYIVAQGKPWEPIREAGGDPSPRRAGVHSFGFGGTNVFLLLQEFGPQPSPRAARSSDPEVFFFSAKTAECLRMAARDFGAWLDDAGADPDRPSLHEVAHTLSVGREAMVHRLAVIATSWAQLKERVEGFVAGQIVPGEVWTGTVNGAGFPAFSVQSAEGEGSEGAEPQAESGLALMAARWVKGGRSERAGLNGSGPVRRVSLPGYCFATTRCWLPATPHGEGSFSPGFAASRAPGQEPQTALQLSGLGSETALLGALHAMVAGLLRVPQSSLGVEESLFRYGLDSIVLVKMARRFKAEFGQSVSLSAMARAATLRDLSHYLWGLSEQQSKRSLVYGTSEGNLEGTGPSARPRADRAFLDRPGADARPLGSPREADMASAPATVPGNGRHSPPSQGDGPGDQEGGVAQQPEPEMRAPGGNGNGHPALGRVQLSPEAARAMLARLEELTPAEIDGLLNELEGTRPDGASQTPEK